MSLLKPGSGDSLGNLHRDFGKSGEQRSVGGGDAAATTISGRGFPEMIVARCCNWRFAIWQEASQTWIER